MHFIIKDIQFIGQRCTSDEYKQTELTSIDYQEKLDKITIDLVNPNEQQPEIEHKMKSQNSHSDYSSEAGKRLA